MTTEIRIWQCKLEYTENYELIDYLQNHITVAPTIGQMMNAWKLYLMKRDIKNLCKS